MHLRIRLAGSLLILLSACSRASPNPAPSPDPSPAVQGTTRPTVTLLVDTAGTPKREVETQASTPTVTLEVSPPAEATGTLSPAAFPTPSPSTTPESTYIQLPTLILEPTPAVTGIPQPRAPLAAIQFLTPGPQSIDLSPVKVYALAVPGYGNFGSIYLYGEDGRLINSQGYQLIAAYSEAYFNWTLPFDVHGVAELARLSMSTEDEFGRIKALNSIHMLLMTEGYSIINPPGDLHERCIIEQPASGFRIRGRMLTVAGVMRPFNDLPLVVELIAWDGTVLDSQLAGIVIASDGGYVPFEATLSYSPSNSGWVRLVVRQPDDRIAGTMYLYSKEIYLNP
jgi:hypothetical protein